MNSPRIVSGVLGAMLSAGVVLAWSANAAAQAQTCAVDSDCGHGFTCQVVAVSGCAGVACPPNEPCPPPPPCEPVEYRECVPGGPCTVDSDCADGMVCLEQTYVNCPPQADYYCPDPATCPKPEPVDCVETTASSCVPRYLAPCTVDSDCGAGFNCVPEEVCSCPPSTPTEPAPAPGVDGGTYYPREPLPPSECTCTEGEPYCQPQQIACSSNADCPADWSCVQYASGGGTCGVEVYPDGGVGEPICEPAPEPVNYSQCEPPYSNYYGYYPGGGVAYPEGAPGDNTGTGSGPVPSPLPPSEGSGTVGLPRDETTAPTDVTTVPGGSESQDSAGCQVRTGRVNGIAGLLLAALGVFAASRRRRR